MENDMPDAEFVVSTPIAINNLQNDFGSDSDELIELFCQGVGVELNKIKVAAAEENRERLLHNARGLRGVCESVYVHDMGQTCSEIEQAGSDLEWIKVKGLIEKLEAEFKLVQEHHGKP